ncbi:hypothetical protein HOLleu_20461 [Holothuria leucospilota]|uniref:Uncharacterized protein n=1 Tax=Holothuria leucospilota TaxID=206669 RepID=A0A9Q1C1E7_HOLLE|nr:hypothetical protein HOLleu_20461 [Holothuria leucospilota]
MRIGSLNLWTQFTKVQKARQGFALYNVLPTKRGVHEKVRLAMQNEEIKISEEDSVKQIFTILDKWYQKDGFSVVCEAWCSFKDLTKKDSDTMDLFLNEYEKKVKALKKEGVTLPEVVMAMQLIDSDGMDKTDKQIVLTAVNYKKKEEMYDQMKNALRKFFGEQAMAYRQKPHEAGTSVKEEPVYATETDEAYFIRSSRGNTGARRGRQGPGQDAEKVEVVLVVVPILNRQQSGLKDKILQVHKPLFRQVGEEDHILEIQLQAVVRKIPVMPMETISNV